MLWKLITSIVSCSALRFFGDLFLSVISFKLLICWLITVIEVTLNIQLVVSFTFVSTIQANVVFFFYTNHPLQGFRSHCSVRGYSSLLVATAEAEATTKTGRQHTHTHTHTQNPQLNPLLPPNMTWSHY